jgi:hypothetical protein
VGKQIEAVADASRQHEPVGTWLPIFGFYLWTGSSAVKRVLVWELLEVEGSNPIEDITFLGAIILIWHLIWHLIGFQGESPWSPWGLRLWC